MQKSLLKMTRDSNLAVLVSDVLLESISSRGVFCRDPVREASGPSV